MPGPSMICWGRGISQIWHHYMADIPADREWAAYGRNVVDVVFQPGSPLQVGEKAGLGCPCRHCQSSVSGKRGFLVGPLFLFQAGRPGSHGGQGNMAMAVRPVVSVQAWKGGQGARLGGQQVVQFLVFQVVSFPLSLLDGRGVGVGPERSWRVFLVCCCPRCPGGRQGKWGYCGWGYLPFFEVLSR